MLGEVGLLLFRGASEARQTALDEAQACRATLRLEAELDEWCIRLAGVLAVRVVPAERKEVGRFEPFDPQVDELATLPATIPAEAALAARAEVELRSR